MTSAYLIGAKRTPLGKLQGTLSGCSAPQLAAEAIRELVKATEIAAATIGEVMLGQVLQLGSGQAPARQAALAAGLPSSTSAVTINRVCGSGLEAIVQAARAIQISSADAVIAGGMESMSRAPHLLLTGRSGLKFGDQMLVDSLAHDGLTCAHEKVAMGVIADRLAKKLGITREEADQFAVASHSRAVAARDAGQFAREIVPISFTAKSGVTLVDRDEGPRDGLAMADVAKLRPAFDAAGTTTAGNASQISDGAAVVMVVSREVADSHRTDFRARIVGSTSVSRDPAELFEAPIDAVRKLLDKADWRIADVDLWEINEAFASQTIACQRGLAIDPEKLNVRGGAIALGHPIGASGARIVVTLLHSLIARGLSRGIATLCLGGGGAVALAVEIE